MKRFLVPFVLVACAVAGATDSAGWKTFRSSAGKYSASFPGQPMTMSQQLDTKAGRVTMHLSGLEMGKSSALLTGYVDFPADQMARHDKDYLLDCFTKGVCKNGKRTLKGERQVSLQGHKGRELIVHAPGAWTTMRVFLKKNRVYVAAFVWSGTTDVRGQAKRFFDSFRIL